MFELLGLSLLLAALLTFNSLASLAIAALWRVAGRPTRNWTAVSRARLLFSLRTLPAVLAFLSVALLLVPAYVAYEPRHAAETVSFKLGLLAFISATGIAVSIYRAIATHRATSRLTSDWLEQAKPVQINGIAIEAFQINHTFPLIAIVGFLRPRLFIASRVLEILTPEEISAAVAHENGHLAARDNLKRGFMRACRDVLLIIPCGRTLDRHWSDASEAAADEHAAVRGRNVALDLASALVKIARMIPAGARPAMPAGVFLVGDEAGGIRARVSRLVQSAGNETRPGRWELLIPKGLLWLTVVSTAAIFVLATTHTPTLASVHSLIEHAVYLLD